MIKVEHALIAVCSCGLGVAATGTAYDWQQAQRHTEAVRLVKICADRGGKVQVGKDLQPTCAAPQFLARRAM